MSKFSDFDIVIGLKSKNGNLRTMDINLFIKKEKRLSKVGLIQNLSLQADVKDALAKMILYFPSDSGDMSEKEKKSHQNNIENLSENGCTVFCKENT